MCRSSYPLRPEPALVRRGEDSSFKSMTPPQVQASTLGSFFANRLEPDARASRQQAMRVSWEGSPMLDSFRQARLIAAAKSAGLIGIATMACASVAAADQIEV